MHGENIKITISPLDVTCVLLILTVSRVLKIVGYSWSLGFIFTLMSTT